MSVDGSDVQQIGPQSGGIAITPPVWSPDGERLAFVVNEIDEESRWSGLRDLYTVRTDGSELVKIGLAGERGRSALTTVATWSPDSQRLAFASYDGEEWLIQTARFDGTDLKEIWRIDPNNASISWIWSVLEVSWSPDGSEILFASGEAYVIHADGSGFRNLGIPAQSKDLISRTGSIYASSLVTRRFRDCGLPSWPPTLYGVPGRHGPARDSGGGPERLAPGGAARSRH